MRNVLFKTGKIAWKVLKKTDISIVTLIYFIEAVTKKEGKKTNGSRSRNNVLYKGKTWHGLVVRVENALSSKEAFIAAGLDWDVQELARTGVTAGEVKTRYNVGNIEDVPGNIYKKVMSALSRTKYASAA